MGKVYRTAMGKQVDIDAIQHINSEVIAVGNMNVNARGDQLGPGGKVVKTRNEVMKEAYKLHTMVPQKPDIADQDPEGNEENNGNQN
jgi:hypothetical protein